MAGKKNLELDARLQKIIDDEFAKYEKYIPNIQDVNVYRRKRKEFWDNISALIKEVNALNGRTDDTAGNAGNE